MIEKERMTEHVMDLIRIDSLSKKEKDMALRLQKDMEDLGAECFYDDAGEKLNGNVGNLIVKLEGNKSDALPFFLSAHMDTVGPGEGIKPRIEDGIMKSDGTTILGSDDKSGVAIIVETIRALKDNSIPHGDIEIAFTICEEIGLLGAKHIDISKFKAKHGIVLDSSTPDRLVLRCPSAERIEFTVHGLEAHAGLCPENGISAIELASEAISKMKLGRIDDITTANIGVIHGGRATNIIPNNVRVVGEARSHSEEALSEQVDHAAMSSLDVGSKNDAQPSASSRSGGMSEQAMGTPAAIASSTGMPKPSNVEGNTSASAYLNRPINVLRGSQPSKWTLWLNPFASMMAFTSSQDLPGRPTTASCRSSSSLATDS